MCEIAEMSAHKGVFALVGTHPRLTRLVAAMERTVFIEDEVLSLVQYTHDDDMDWHHCWMDADTQRGYNVKFDHRTFDPSQRQDISRFPFWATIYDKKNRQFVGVVRLSPPPYDDCDLAIWIYKPYRKMGYGTRAFRLGVLYCIENLGLEKVGAGCYADNLASRKMLEKIGFVRAEESDNHETNVFTGEPIVQQAYVITKNDVKPQD